MQLKAFLASRAAIAMGESIAVSALMLLNFALLTRIVDAETLGLWFLFGALIGYARLLDVWSTGLSSFVAEALGKGDRPLALGYVGTALGTAFVASSAIASVGAALLWFLAPLLVDAANVARIRGVLPLMAAVFWLSSLAGSLQMAFLGFGRPGLKAVQQVGGGIVFLAGAFLAAPAWGLAGIIAAQLGQALFSLGFGLAALVLAIAPGGRGLAWRQDRFRAIAALGSRQLVLGAVNLSVDPIIRLLANHYGGLALVTVVELVSRLIVAVRALIVSLANVAVPALAHAGSTGREAAHALFRDIRTLHVLLTVPAFALMAALSPWVEVILLARDGSGFPVLLMVLSAGWAANTLATPAHALLLARRHMRPLIWAHVLLSGIGLAAGVALGEAFGIVGAMGGMAAGLAIAALYLDRLAAEGQRGAFGLWPTLAGDPLLLAMAVLAASVPVLSATHAAVGLGVPGVLLYAGVVGAVVVAIAVRPAKVRTIMSLARGMG